MACDRLLQNTSVGSYFISMQPHLQPPVLFIFMLLTAKMPALPLSLGALYSRISLPSSHHWCVEKACCVLLCREWTMASLGQNQARCLNNRAVRTQSKGPGFCSWDYSDGTEGRLTVILFLHSSLEMVFMAVHLDQNPFAIAKHYFIMLWLLEKRFRFWNDPSKTDSAFGALKKKRHTHLCRKGVSALHLRVETL